MKKLIVVLLLAGAGYAAYALTIGRPVEQRACAHLADLCASSHPDRDRADCEQTFADLKKVGGAEAIAKPTQCLVDAQSCGAGVGCMAGAIGRAGVNFGSDFLKGLGDALGK